MSLGASYIFFGSLVHILILKFLELELDLKSMDKQVRDVAQLVNCLPGMQQTLGLIPDNP